MIFSLIAIQFSLQAQISDIISVQKKNGRTIKNFYEGSRILFQTKNEEYIEGPIEKIYHDSIFVKMYTIQKMMSAYGSYVFDTLNTYIISKNYKDISRISVYSHHREVRRLMGSAMMIAGAGYAALNLINGSLFNLPVTNKKNLKTLGISAGLFAAGFINNKFFPPNLFSRKKDRIVYISLNK
jgi:hypothetical protein